MFFYTYDGAHWTKHYNYTQLINYLSIYNKDWFSDGYNSFLAATSPTGEDLALYIDWHGKPQYIKRDHRVTQEDFISIYCEYLKEDVREWSYVASIEHERRILEEKDTAWQNELVRAGYQRRRKHYQWSHKPRHHSGHYSSGTHKRDLQYAADPEHSQFIRPARNLRNLPSFYDDHWHQNSSGWKRSTKCRNQWEPNIIREYKKEKNKSSLSSC